MHSESFLLSFQSTSTSVRCIRWEGAEQLAAALCLQCHLQIVGISAGTGTFSIVEQEAPRTHEPSKKTTSDVLPSYTGRVV